MNNLNKKETGVEETNDSNNASYELVLKRLKIQITLPKIIANVAGGACKLVASPLQIYTLNKPTNANLLLQTKKHKE